ncbi:uncharacterized protein LOC130674978 [Microplitis mediator]|uniref:uncharacterized protein LOC130674978 n=1 Tax=Microplitis mediator TaxID=375433 RepID=UPI002555D2BC|nr:uncharacterized protein LOC130674978 [Microplitis mediator]
MFLTSLCPSDSPIRFDEDNVNYNLQDYNIEDPLSKLSKSEEKLYGDPAVKYPTLSKDDNGYYIFEQKLDNFYCYNEDVSKCELSKYPWYINSFTYEFNEDIKFDCERNSDNFDPKDISSIQDELFEKWNNKMDDVTEAFGFRWSYGARCSAYFKGLDSPFKFYKKSIELFDKYNMDVILRDSNIIPGNNYTFQAITDAVSKGLKGTKAEIKCSKRFGEKIYDLSTIKIYFDQSFNPINKTRDTDNTAIECPLDENIRYENFIHSVKEVPVPSFDYPAIF